MPAKQTNIFTSQLLHQPAFYTNPFFYKLAFTPTSCYTNELLHAPASTQTNFSTNQLLHKPRFAPTNLYTPIITQTSFYTNQLLHKPTFGQTTFYANHLLQRAALHNPCFGPVSQGPEGRRNAEGCYMYEGCIFKNYMISDAFNIIVIVISEIYAWYISIKKNTSNFTLGFQLKNATRFPETTSRYQPFPGYP